MRLFPLAFWVIVSFLLTAYTMLIFIDGGSFLVALLLAVTVLALYLRPTAKYLFGKVITEIRTDGLYVITDSPPKKPFKLLTWNQFSGVTLKYYPEFGHMGYARGGLALTPWSYGLYAALMLGYYRVGCFFQKPLFGEKEIHFVLKNKAAGDLIVLNTNRPSEFVDALETVMSGGPDNSFKVTVEPKPTFRERYLPTILYFLVAVLIIAFVIMVSHLF